MRVAEFTVLEKNAAGEITKASYREKGKRKHYIINDADIAKYASLFIVSKMIGRDAETLRCYLAR